MRKIFWIIITAFIVGCGQSYKEQKQLTKAEHIRLLREDSAALKIAVMPTLDCLPLLVARECSLYNHLGADIRLRMYMAQMDCDTALLRGRVEGMVSDLVRTERIIHGGVPLRYVSATNAYWQLFTNKTARIKEFSQMDGKMIAMTRYSATDMLSDYMIDSVKLKSTHVFKVQINDVYLRWLMLQNNELDALFLTEPYATAARMAKHHIVMDTRTLGMNFGVIAFNRNAVSNETRKKQIEVFIKAYNSACDSINHYGIRHYKALIERYSKVSPQAIDSIPASYKYPHASLPRYKDIEKAVKWLR